MALVVLRTVLVCVVTVTVSIGAGHSVGVVELLLRGGGQLAVERSSLDGDPLRVAGLVVEVDRADRAELVAVRVARELMVSMSLVLIIGLVLQEGRAWSDVGVRRVGVVRILANGLLM